MSEKLQNIKAVKQLLDGTHKSQTKTSVSLSDTTKKNKKRVIGETWIEKNANGVEFKWEQKDGFRVKRPLNSILDQVTNALTLPAVCPTCEQDMHGKEKRLNQKMYFKAGKCFDCVTKEETLIRSDKKKWEEYSSKKMLANATGWFKDADKEVEILKSTLKDIVWENADGQVGEVDRTKWLKKIDKDYKKIKKQIINNLTIDKKND
tara:strand:+ start:2566 stop:3183 length:618 start_codon:yes stop_codon:yes gene_type:complete